MPMTPAETEYLRKLHAWLASMHGGLLVADMALAKLADHDPDAGNRPAKYTPGGEGERLGARAGDERPAPTYEAGVNWGEVMRPTDG